VDGSTQIEIEVLTGLDQIDAEDWDACACPEASDGGRPNDPFTTHRFLRAGNLALRRHRDGMAGAPPRGPLPTAR
jgi:predicted N-acyltransferase